MPTQCNDRNRETTHGATTVTVILHVAQRQLVIVTGNPGVS
jgi:hypothetical protein